MEDALTRRIDTAIKIAECLNYMIRVSSPTKQKVYHIYRQFREWGYTYELKDISINCERFYGEVNFLNQARLIRNIFNVEPSSEIALVLALNFRCSELKFSRMREISLRLFSLLKRVSQPDSSGIDLFIVQAAVRRLTSPNWNHGDVHFSLEDFFDCLRRESFRRFGDRYQDKLIHLFYSMDPSSNAQHVRAHKMVSHRSTENISHPGQSVSKGSVCGSGIQDGDIERLNDDEALNDEFTVRNKVILQAEFLWLVEVERHLLGVSPIALPMYPLGKAPSAKELRQIESQVRLFNHIYLFRSGSSGKRDVDKYGDIRQILKNTILKSVSVVLEIYGASSASKFSKKE